ncbi:MAG: ankyrin repeat domain-containing protein [Dechloromonas sp.]|nr:ankyrin repeat domain-containing protein [Dechloromonas sp.]
MTTKGFTTSSLIEAIRTGDIRGVALALKNGDDVELPDVHGFGGLPLRTACFDGNLAIVRELLKHGANPDAASCDGIGAPLRLALRKNHQDIVNLLLENGAAPVAGALASLETPDTSLQPVFGATTESPTPKHDPGNVIEYSTSSLSLPGDEDIFPLHPESKPDNLIEFSSPDGHFSVDCSLPDDKEQALPGHLGTETSVLSMDLLFLDENEAPETQTSPSDKGQLPPSRPYPEFKP